MTKKPSHIRIGEKGEEIAREFILRKGYKILAQNYRTGHLEIDLIAMDGKEIVFIEVKTRKQNTHYTEDLISETKQERLMEAAEEYLHEMEIHNEPRFDLISIQLGNETEIMHYKDALLP